MVNKEYYRLCQPSSILIDRQEEDLSKLTSDMGTVPPTPPPPHPDYLKPE